MILKCNMTDCTYNTNNICGAEVVRLMDFRNVKNDYGHTLCDTFSKRQDKRTDDEHELAICGDCDQYETCPLIGHEARGECEKIKAGRGEGK